MKNKFMLMAVVSTFFAILILPSALAQDTDDTLISAAIATGTFSLTCAGDFMGTLNMDTLDSVPLNPTSVSYTGQYSDSYCKVIDYDATPGAKIKIKMSSTDSGNFEYIGTAGGNNIMVENLEYIPKWDSGNSIPISPNKAVDDATATLNIISAESAASSENPASFTFHESFTTGDYYKFASGTDIDYLISNVAGPVAYRVGFQKLRLTVPALSAPGVYRSTLVITAIAGNT